MQLVKGKQFFFFEEFPEFLNMLENIFNQLIYPNSGWQYSQNIDIL